MQNIIFFGSDQYSAIVLKHLIESKPQDQETGKLGTFSISVVTEPGKPRGRKQIITHSPVEQLARDNNLPVSYYPDLPTITPDTIGVACSFDHLIPEDIIKEFPQGILNLHPSLLPQYRNVSPVQYAIALGDKTTGISIFKITPGIDNGEIVAQQEEAIQASDTTPTLSTRLFNIGADLLIRYLTQLSSGMILSEQVSQRGSSRLSNNPLIFTKRLTRDSGYIEWEVIQKLLNNTRIQPSQTNNELLLLRLSQKSNGSNHRTILNDLVRALHPWPSVWTIANTTKGDLRISLVPQIINNKYELKILISGKPKPIMYNDFIKYYLE